jgi:uncharacterized protein
MAVTVSEKLDKLRAIFQELGSVLVAFSGGIDSTVVFKLAWNTLHSNAVAVTAVSPTFPEIELEATQRLATEIGGRHVIIETDQLTVPEFVRNDERRCYHCKTDLYQALGKLREELGIQGIVDGTNLDDLGDDRPGMLAAREWGVRSPLVEAGLSKSEIRSLAKAWGLSNWDKPAAACLSSRVARGELITLERLTRIEKAEAFLVGKGFRQIRVRDYNGEARVEVGQDELDKLFESTTQTQIIGVLRALGFQTVTLDRAGYRQGNANQKTLNVIR